MKEYLADQLGNLRSWMHKTYLSDNMHILLQWKLEDPQNDIPFKFN